MWTRHGLVWATLRVATPLSYGSRPVKDKLVVREVHQVLLRALPGESLLLGVMTGTDAAQVVQAAIAGIDLAAHPGLVDEVEAVLPLLDELPLGERTHWVAVPLPNDGANRWREPLRSGLSFVKDLAALPRALPSEQEVAVRMRQVEELVAAIPAMFGARPATVAEQVWLASTAQHRGLVDLECPGADPVEGGELMALTSGCAVAAPVVDEGGVSDLPRGRARGWNPLSRRFLKITDPRADLWGAAVEQGGRADDVDESGHPGGPVASYQVPMVIADMPAGGMAFPGSEYLAELDRCGVDVDWAVRLDITGGEEALAKTRRAVRNLNDQYDQREGAVTTGQHELDRAGELLTEFQASLAVDKQEVQVAHTTYLAVAGPDPVAAVAAAGQVAKALDALGITVDRPVGGLEEMWWQMLPGVPSTRITRQYAQFTTAGHYACVVPLTASRLGDRTGGPLALIRSTSRPRVVLHHLEGHTRLNVSGSVGAVAELGAGKTHLLLMLCGMVADRGGQNLVIDRSAEGEYARFVRTLPHHVVVDLASPQWSMDPLRILDAAAGPRVAHTFVTVLTGVRPQSPEGVVLAEVLAPAYLAAHELGSLAAVLAHLQSERCHLQGARDLARQVAAIASSDLGAAVFDPDLPATPMDAHVVWRTNVVQLPTERELTEGHLFDRLPLAKLYGRAYYTLIPLLCHEISRINPHRLTWLTCDEAHAINSFPESRLALTTFIREGRRALSGVGLASHDSDDFGDEVQRGLIRTRIALRQSDLTLARRALEFVGFDPADPGFDEVVEAMRHDTSPLDRDGRGVRPERRGEGWMRDISGALEPIRILPQARPERAHAADTTPGVHATHDVAPLTSAPVDLPAGLEVARP